MTARPAIYGADLPIHKIGRDVFTTGQIARLCGVAPRTVTVWCDSGRIKHYRIPGSKDRRVLRADLIEFMKGAGLPMSIPQYRQVLFVGMDETICRLVANGSATIVRSLFDLAFTMDRYATRHVIVLNMGAVGRGEGCMAAHRLRREYPKAVLIALASEDETRALELSEAGFATVLLSPVSPIVLRQAVEQASKE